MGVGQQNLDLGSGERCVGVRYVVECAYKTASSSIFSFPLSHISFSLSLVFITFSILFVVVFVVTPPISHSKMPNVFSYTFDTPVYKGTAKFNTGLYIGGKWVDPVEGGTHE